MGKASNLAVAFGCLVKIQVGQRVRLGRARPYFGHLQQVFPDQMGQLAFHRTDTEVDAGFTEIDRLELRVAVGHVQERHVTELGDVVQAIGGRGGIRVRIAAHAHARHGARANQLEKLTLG